MAIPRGPWNIAILILSMEVPAPTRAAIRPLRMLSVEVHINLIRTHIVDAERKLHRTEGGVHTFIEAVVAQRTAETGAGDVSRHAVLLVAVTGEDYCPQGIARPWTDCAEGHMPCWQRASRSISFASYQPLHKKICYSQPMFDCEIRFSIRTLRILSINTISISL